MTQPAARHLVRLLLAACLAVVLSAQTPLFPPDRLAAIQQGLRDLYDMQYDQAEETFQTMIREAPDDPAGYAYLAMTYWVRELSGKQELSLDRFASSDFFSENPKFRPAVDPRVEQRFREVNRQAIDKARLRLQASPGDRAALFLRGLAYQNLAAFETGLKRNWWGAFRAGTKTFRDHKELLRRDPEFHDARLSVGVYEYVAGSLNWSLKWLAFFLGHYGSKEEGKRQLRLAAEKGTLTADDASTILILIYTREKRYSPALELLERLREKYPRNFLVPLDMAGIALRTRETDKAIEIYRQMLGELETGPSRYLGLERASLFNGLGVAFRQKGETATAEDWFAKALGETGASLRTTVIARLELAKTYDLLGRRDDAVKLYQAVQQAEDFAGSRLEAERLLRRAFR